MLQYIVPVVPNSRDAAAAELKSTKAAAAGHIETQSNKATGLNGTRSVGKKLNL